MFSANTSQVSNDVKYIEDFFSAWLRTGTGSSQTVTTGIKENTGALVISKSRSAATDWAWYDTFRGATKDLVSNSTAAETTQSQGLTAFNTDGHTWGTLAKVNTSGATYVDFVLKPTPKFFDVVTYTGNGGTPQNIAHSLGSVPGCIIVKPVSGNGPWIVYHRSQPSSGGVEYNGVLNETAAWNNLFASSGTDIFRIATFGVTSTNFTIGTQAAGSYAVNANGVEYVAYLFAHNAGGFGLTGTDNVISCGSYAGTGSSTVSISLGYEPQWVLIKKFSGSTFTDGSASWCIFDNMRGIPTGGSDACLYANLSGAENSEGAGNFINVTATGFEVPPTGNLTNQSACSYIYIAIRRGPMKVPESGTSVFAAAATRSSGIDQANPMFYTGWPVDLLVQGFKAGSTNAQMFIPRLTNNILRSSNTDAETNGAGAYSFTGMNGVISPSGSDNTTSTICGWNFRRAPGFFDVVCWTGNGASTRSVNHNLTVAPELLIAQNRTSGGNWYTYLPSGNVRMALNSSSASPVYGGAFAGTTPTATTFSFDVDLNTSGQNYVAYLFASCPGVSKVGSYTGTGTTQQINCGFTGGARFVLIKRTDSTGDWYVWDSARGIVAGNDPYLLLNSTAAEVTNTDYVDTYSAGFEISSTAPAAINASGGSFIFLAIA